MSPPSNRAFEAVAPFLDERGRRLVAASEALTAGRGGVKAVCAATAVARSTIGRGLAELRGGEPSLLRLVITLYKIEMFWATRRPIARAILAATGGEPGPVRQAVA